MAAGVDRRSDTRFFAVVRTLRGWMAHECSHEEQKKNRSPRCSSVQTVRVDPQDGHGGGRAGDECSWDTESPPIGHAAELVAALSRFEVVEFGLHRRHASELRIEGLLHRLEQSFEAL